MSRGVSTKLLGQLPESYTADWLSRMDKRSSLWRAISDRIATLETDAGGADTLSHAERSIIRRAVFLELLCESEEVRFAAGEPLNVGAYSQAFNSMIGAYRAVGIKRRARPVRRLADAMRADG